MRSLLTAMQFLYGLRAGQGGESPQERESARWVAWFAPLGLAVGVMLALLILLAWGPIQPPLQRELWLVVVPALMIYWLGPASGRYVGWARTWASIRLGGRLNDLDHDAYPGIEATGIMVLAVATAALAQYVAFANLPYSWPLLAQNTPSLRLLFPRANYGAPVLMAMWGNACVLLAACLGRPAGHAEPEVRQLLAMPTLSKLLWAEVAPLALTALFLVGWLHRGGTLGASTIVLAAFDALAIAVILFGVTMLFAWLLARRVQGHCRATLLSAGLIGELVFLLLFYAIIKTGSLL
ncbi:MAG: hypothetical protein PHU85_09705 [Phycisphaerae bacterium]|nr:hypothetical protein [Phycisphaerae bacterium]